MALQTYLIKVAGYKLRQQERGYENETLIFSIPELVIQSKAYIKRILKETGCKSGKLEKKASG